MGQIAKRLTFGHESSSSNDALKRKIPRKMIQTSILRYITSDRQHLTALNSSSLFLRFPYHVRRRIYEYAGLTDGHFISLNYDYPTCVNSELPAFDAWYALPPREDEDVNLGQAPIIYQHDDEFDTVDCEEEEFELIDEDYDINDYSHHISRFLYDPILPLGVRFNRELPSCCKLSWETGDCSCDFDEPLFPSTLLAVCRQISNEVAHLFYSRNHFKICQTNDGGFSGLLSIKPAALSWLTSLSINIAFCECASFDTNQLSGYCSGHRSCPLFSIPGHQEFVRSTILRHRSGEMTKWKTLCQHLATSISPQRLKLWLRCEVASLESAKEIIGPLMEMPVLRSCSIQLSSEPFVADLREFARGAALKLTGQRSNTFSTPFRYLDLPREIQLHILRYTDLVADNDIAWCSEPPLEGPQVFEMSSLVWEGSDFSARDGPTYQFKCCGKCSDGRESCCCFLMHAGFSTSCACWRMPFSLSLVSQQMREDSTAIFFSQNHFVILPLDDIKPEKPLEILQFFYRLATRGKKYLQSITWILPEYEYMDWTASSLGDWIRAIDICAKHLDLRRLSFTLDLSFQARRRADHGLHYNYHRPLPIHRLEESEWNIGLLLAGSMAVHKEWKNVYVHLSWPWHNVHNPVDPYTSSKEARILRQHQEKVLEQQVMGPSYVAEGKYDRRHAWNGYLCSFEDCKDC